MDISIASPSDLKSLFNLFTITEELLFSIPLNSDLVEKYMLLRESGLKKVGLPLQASKLWDLQKQAHQELDQKHTADAKQIQELSTQLDYSRQSFKELWDSGQKILDFLRGIVSETSSLLNKAFPSKPQRDSFHLSLVSNYSQLNNSIQSEFLVLKESLQENLEEIKEGLKSSQKSLSDLKQALKDSQGSSDLVNEKMNSIRKTHLKEIDDLTSSFKSAENKKNKEVEELKVLLKSLDNKKNREIEEIKEKYEREIRILEEEKSYAIENFSMSIKNSHKKEIKELELSFKAKENSLLEELDFAANSDTQVLKTLRENLEKTQIKVQDLREVLRAISERASALFQKYAFREENESDYCDRKEEICKISDNKIWKQYAELLTQLDFMGLTFKKLSADNDWLVEQIDELSKENKKERTVFEYKDPSYEQVISTLSANESVIKDFQDARSKLLKQFADAKRNS